MTYRPFDSLVSLRHRESARAVVLFLALPMCAVSVCAYLGAQKPKPAIANNGKVVKWSYLGEFVCTRYCRAGFTKAKWDDGYTATMTRIRYGVVAVDPKVIPLGSTVRVEGFDNVVFSAEDVGGAIKGKRMDIWHPSKRYCLQWGKQKRKVWRKEQ